ncbi:hypothetical protein [Polyangium sp. y55x31]|uniref:hypothetical protein n=1 Tax=Polyangium sp. y55x31 TaxID=3042688 RepID=UPI0024832BFD|nr:hypothetical protein [Polyangium sp. y55x31]MDI1478906.1 hypothetical protein [Polyangium sp. y55x31]
MNRWTRASVSLLFALLAAACCHEPCKPPKCGGPVQACPNDCPAPSCADLGPQQGSLNAMVEPLAKNITSVLAEPSFLPQERYTTCFAARVLQWRERLATIYAAAEAAGRLDVATRAQNLAWRLKLIGEEDVRRQALEETWIETRLADLVRVVNQPPP